MPASREASARLMLPRSVAAGAEPVVSEAALARLAAAREASLRLSESTSVYGRTTGVGANRLTAVTASDDHGMRLIRSHAADAGELLDERTVRAFLAVRLAQLTVAGSGIDPGIVVALQRQLAARAHPEIRELGGLGTADLQALAASALALAGERPTQPPLEVAVRFDAASALPYLSSNALTIARTCLQVERARRLDRAAIGLFAVAALALDANPQAVSPLAAHAVAAPRVAEVFGEIRALLAGSPRPPARIQDPYGLRISPIVHATLRTAVERLGEHCERLLSAAQENPRFDADLGVAHHGAFFQSQLALELDSVNIAVARAASTMHALLRMTSEPAFTGGLRPFLAMGPEGSSGLMMLEYTAGAALAEARAAASPASIGTLSTSRGVEEDACFATQGVRQLERALDGLELVLACVAIAACRALTQREIALTPRLAALGDLVGTLAGEPDDHDLAPDIERARASLAEFATAVARAVATGG